MSGEYLILYPSLSNDAPNEERGEYFKLPNKHWAVRLYKLCYKKDENTYNYLN